MQEDMLARYPAPTWSRLHSRTHARRHEKEWVTLGWEWNSRDQSVSECHWQSSRCTCAFMFHLLSQCMCCDSTPYEGQSTFKHTLLPIMMTNKEIILGSATQKYEFSGVTNYSNELILIIGEISEKLTWTVCWASLASQPSLLVSTASSHM